MKRQGTDNNSRKQADFLKRMDPKERENHMKQFMASCESDMLLPFVTITNHDKHFRAVEYEIDVPDHEELVRLKKENEQLSKDYTSLYDLVTRYERALENIRREARNDMSIFGDRESGHYNMIPYGVAETYMDMADEGLRGDNS